MIARMKNLVESLGNKVEELCQRKKKKAPKMKKLKVRQKHNIRR